MLKRSEYEQMLGRPEYFSRIPRESRYSQEDLNTIAKRMPVRVMKSPQMFCQFAVNEGLGLPDCAAVLAWIYTMSEFLNDISVSSDICYDDTVRYFETARVNAIIIYRVNYILHMCMLEVYDT